MHYCMKKRTNIIAWMYVKKTQAFLLLETIIISNLFQLICKIQV